MEYYKFQNGFEVIFKKRKGSKVVGLFLGIKVGSVNEPANLAGISHFIEHLLFKGKNTSSIIEGSGGYLNAYTSLDETVYYILVPSYNIKIALNELKELVFNPRFSREEVELEKSIILEELKGGKDLPVKFLYEKLFEHTFKTHPYRNPVIGYKETIENINYSILLNFYKSNYTPKKSSLIIVGDVDRNLVFEEVKKHFGSLKESEVNGNYYIEPKEDYYKNKFSFIPIFHEFEQNYLSICFKLPKFLTKEFIALDIFANFFGTGQDSILTKKLKKEKALVDEIVADIYPLKYSNIFFITAIFSKEKDYKEILDVIFKSLNEYHERELNYSDIEKSIINLKSEVYFDRENISDEAKKILFYHLITGNYKNEKFYLKTLNNITPKLIKKSIKEWLSEDFATVILIHSDKNKDYRYIPFEKKEKKKQIKQNLLSFSLDNGINLIFYKDSKTPLIAFRAGGLGGVKFENSKINGISYLLAKFLTKGSKNYCENEIFKEIEGKGGELSTFSGRNSIGIAGYILKQEFFNVFNILIDILFNSVFPEFKLNQIKNEILNKIKAERDNPYDFCINNFYKEFFRNHPYSFNIKGTEKSVKNIKLSQIKEFYEKLFIPENITFSFAGDIDYRFIDYSIEQLEEIPKKGELKVPEIQYKSLKKEKVIEKNLNKNQVHIITGFSAPSLKDEDSITMSFIKNCMGLMSGRLFNEIREKLGICYSIFPFYLKGVDAGCFGIYIVTDLKHISTAINEINNVVSQLYNDGLMDEEIEKTKNYIIGNYLISKQKFINIATNNFFNLIYNLGLDYEKIYLQKIKNLNKKDIKDCINKYLKGPKLTLIFK